MAYPGVPTDTSVAFMERTTQMKVNARTSFFVGEGKGILSILLFWKQSKDLFSNIISLYSINYTLFKNTVNTLIIVLMSRKLV